MLDVDYEKIGLKVGLEIHQQLNVGAKLFCDCRPELFKEQPETTFLRRLRPTQSELGQVDPAAYFEFQKGARILYEANRNTSCLVEMDEEPPHKLNVESVETVLTVALMLNAKPIDEIHVMRKTVIDGSNTTGFQRTCVAALNGEIKIGEKAVPIQHTSLEEDAARKTGEEGGSISHYRIDRLGIPLIEIATAPTIKSPKEAEEVAFAIGGILRATGKVMRGLGTIRQDLNVSIRDGALVEIKGVQELELISLAVEYEIQRQLKLIEIREELKKRDAREEELKDEFIDVTKVFEQTKCKVLRKALEKNQRILAVRLPKFRGLLKQELLPDIRLGTEMADRARFWGRVGGLFHTDEMPAYGVTAEEVEALWQTIAANERDTVVFVADRLENAQDSLKAVVERSREAIRGVPEETRSANPDGTTRYMRPRPGAARMYPETDIPPTHVTEGLLRKIKSNLPEVPEQKLERLIEEYKINQKLARQIIDSEHSGLFEIIVKGSNVSPTVVAAFLTETMKSLRRDGVRVERVSENQIEEIFRSMDSGELVKESIPEIVRWLCEHENKSVAEAVTGTGLKMITKEELERTVDEALKANRTLIEERGANALGALMSAIMKRVRGKAKADVVSKLLRERLEAQDSRKQ